MKIAEIKLNILERPGVGEHRLVEVPGLRLLVVQQEAFMGSVEIRAAQAAEIASRRMLDEIQRARNALHDRLVSLRLRRVTHPVQVPVLRVMQIGKTTVHQRTNEIQGQRRALVSAQQQLRVRFAVAGSE